MDRRKAIAAVMPALPFSILDRVTRDICNFFRQRLRVAFHNAGLASDSVKINVEQIFKMLSASTDIKTLYEDASWIVMDG